MSQPFILAVDLGTQSVRAAAIDADGKILKLVQIAQETDNPQPGWAQQRPEHWWRLSCEVIRQVLSSSELAGRSVAAVSCCGQMHGPVGIDVHGDLTTPWVQLWCDKRCAPQVDFLRREFGDKLFLAETGNAPNPAWTGIKILWEKEHHAAAYAASRHYLVPKDFLNFRLSGVAATDPSEASCSAIYDWRSGEYSPGLAAAMGLDLAKFPPIFASHEIIGRVTASASLATGLPVGTPVVAGGGDFPVSMLGFGIAGEGLLADVTGTSSLLAAHSPAPLIDAGIQNCRHVIPGWIPFTILDCGGLSMTWCRDLFASSGAPASYEDLIRLAAEAPAGSEGLLFLPYLRGERRSDNLNAKGVFSGIGLQHRAPHFIRSVMEGVALAMARDAEAFAALGLRAGRVLSVGGGTRNALWNRIKADALDLPLEVSPEPEAGLQGCALLGASAAGLIGDPAATAIARRQSGESITPDPEGRRALASAANESRRLYEHLLGFHDHLKSPRS